MRIAYAGTPEFAVPALEALHAQGHAIVGVWTQPDRPAGRGQRCVPGAVKRRALELGFPVHQPSRLDDAAALAPLRASAAEVMVVVAYGLLLPPAVLAMFPYGALNIHPSLLPRWRGAAPIQRAMLAGDAQTGVCIMQMDAGLDTGPVLACETLTIAAHDTAGSLHDRLAALGARLIGPALAGLVAGTVRAVPQAEEGATYAAKIAKREARIDWQQPAEQLARRIRAFNPAPGATAHLRDVDVKLWQAHVHAAGGAPDSVPGTVLRVDAQGIVVACGRGALVLTCLQRAGARRLDAAAFARGLALCAGERFS